MARIAFVTMCLGVFPCVAGRVEDQDEDELEERHPAEAGTRRRASSLQVGASSGSASLNTNLSFQGAASRHITDLSPSQEALARTSDAADDLDTAASAGELVDTAASKSQDGPSSVIATAKAWRAADSALGIRSPGLLTMASIKKMYNTVRDRLDILLNEAWNESSKGADLQKPFISQESWVSEGKGGSITLERARILAPYLLGCKPTSLLEIGSFLGLSSAFYLEIMAPWDGHVTSVDPNLRHRVFEHPRAFYHAMTEQYGTRVSTEDAVWMTNVTETGLWDYSHRHPKYIQESIDKIISATPVLKPEDFETRGKKFDAAFIDAAHDEDSVIRDFKSMKNLMSEEACVIFDDADQTPVKTAIGQINKSMAGKGKVRIDGTVALFISGNETRIQQIEDEIQKINNARVRPASG